jgi:chromosome segregation ATPase
MPIDWPKAEAKPEKKQSVPGRDLLELRARINNLERQLRDTKKKLKETQSELNSKGEDLETKTNNLDDVKSKLNNEKEVLGDIRSSLELALTKFEEESKIHLKLNSEIETYKNNIEQANSKIMELEHNTIELTTVVSNLFAELKYSKSQLENLEKSTMVSKTQNLNLNSTIQDLNNKLIVLQEDNTNLNHQLVELNDLLTQKDSKIQDLSKRRDDEDILIRAQTAHLEEVESELTELQPLSGENIVPPYETRITCPMCQSVGKDIREEEDRAKVLYYSGSMPIYAKKFVCKKCGYEWK